MWLSHKFPDGYITVGFPFFGSGALVRNKTDFRPFTRDMSFFIKERMPCICLTGRLPELGSDIAAYGKFDSAEAEMFFLVIAIPKQIVLIPCRIGAEPDGLYTIREKRECLNEDTELFMSCGNIPVPKLCMKD
jgi:hypothetical protein